MYDIPRSARRRWCPISLTAAVLAAAVSAAGAIADIHRLFQCGMVVFMLAATSLLCLRTGVNSDLLEHARQAGYDAGYLARGELEDSDAQVRHLHAI